MTFRSRASRSVATVLAGVLLFALSSCAPSPDRSASGDQTVTAQKCPNHNSWTKNVHVVNMTQVPITLGAKEWTCSDWSENGNPGAEFTDQVVSAGGVRSFKLEPRQNVNRYWTMTFESPGLELSGARIAIGDAGSDMYIGETYVEEDDFLIYKKKIGLDPAQKPSGDFIPVAKNYKQDGLLIWSDGTSLYAITTPPLSFGFD